MSNKHYIIFENSKVHPSCWLIHAESIAEAMKNYLIIHQGAVIKDGMISMEESDSVGDNHYAHPLEAIEMAEKSHCEWHIRRLTDSHWNSRLAEVFCGEDPYSVEEYIEACLPYTKAKALAKVERPAFVWYLKEGRLVSFLGEERKTRKSKRLFVMDRFLYRWKETLHPEIIPWHGNYDDILDQLLLDPPLYPAEYLKKQLGE